MAIFLVDYENVTYAGLKGVKYLDSNDTLILFYGKDSHYVRRDDLKIIEESGCKIRVFRLENTGKNAIDFYITTYLGMIYNSEDNYAAIVSGDSGFKAVQDFFAAYDDTFKVIIGKNIEKCVIKLPGKENKYKKKQAYRDTARVDIGAEFASMEEKKRIETSIDHILKGTQFENCSEEIASIFFDTYLSTNICDDAVKTDSCTE